MFSANDFFSFEKGTGLGISRFLLYSMKLLNDFGANESQNRDSVASIFVSFTS